MGVASAQVSAAATCGSLHTEGKSVEVALLPRLPATLPLASPMVHSRLPLPSLLGLFDALLMLNPELLLGVPEGLFRVPVTDPGVQRALAFTVEKYNQDRKDSANYFKQLQLFEAQKRADAVRIYEYHLAVELVKTKCKKKAGKIRKYKRIQKCKQLPGNQEKKYCYFLVITSLPPFEFDFIIPYCLPSGSP